MADDYKNALWRTALYLEGDNVSDIIIDHYPEAQEARLDVLAMLHEISVVTETPILEHQTAL